MGWFGCDEDDFEVLGEADFGRAKVKAAPAPVLVRGNVASSSYLKRQARLAVPTPAPAPVVRKVIGLRQPTVAPTLTADQRQAVKLKRSGGLPQVAPTAANVAAAAATGAAFDPTAGKWVSAPIPPVTPIPDAIAPLLPPPSLPTPGPIMPSNVVPFMPQASDPSSFMPQVQPAILPPGLTPGSSGHTKHHHKKAASGDQSQQGTLAQQIAQAMQASQPQGGGGSSGGGSSGGGQQEGGGGQQYQDQEEEDGGDTYYDDEGGDQEIVYEVSPEIEETAVYDETDYNQEISDDSISLAGEFGWEFDITPVSGFG
jgi:uncharacterized membrane protein YgcG